MFKTEVKKSFRNPYFIAAFIFMSAIAGSAAVEMLVKRQDSINLRNAYLYDSAGNMTRALEYSATSLYCKWLGSGLFEFMSVAFYFLIFLVCVLPFGWSLLKERKGGVINNIIVRGGRGRYYLSKYAAAFLSGGTVVVVPMLMNWVICACFVPAYLPTQFGELYMGITQDQVFSQLFFTVPLLYALSYTLMTFVFAGLWATVCVSLSFFCKNMFTLLIVPYLFLLFLHFITRSFTYELSPIYFVIQSQVGHPNRLGIILLWIAAILIFDVLVYLVKGRKKDVL